jgi:short-subunit dehydrogenase involved in D-alanine esterification of teichoic acids
MKYVNLITGFSSFIERNLSLHLILIGNMMVMAARNLASLCDFAWDSMVKQITQIGQSFVVFDPNMLI